MNNSIVSLCHEWQDFQLPSRTTFEENSSVDDVQYRASVKKILELIEDLSRIRAQKEMVAEKRLSLARRILRWDASGEVDDPNFCWNCLFHGNSFRQESAGQIVKTIKTFLFKETTSLRALTQLVDSPLLVKIKQLPGGILNWKLAVAFTADVQDLVTALRLFVEDKIQQDSSETAINSLVDDLAWVVEPEIFQQPDGGIRGLEKRGELEAKRAETEGGEIKRAMTLFVRDSLLLPCGRLLRAASDERFKQLAEELLNQVKSHYRLVEMNLSDYLNDGGYEGNAEIAAAISAFKKSEDLWNTKTQSWSPFLDATDSSVYQQFREAVANVIKEQKLNFESQKRTLERIKRRTLDSNNVVDQIIAHDLASWIGRGDGGEEGRGDG